MAPDSPPRLTQADREKLARLLGMLGSAHAGERDNAARMADALVRRAGATWVDVVLSPTLPASDAPPSFNVFHDWPRSWRTAVHVCQQAPAGLSDWDRDFLAVIAAYQHRPSAKQLDILATILGCVLDAGGAA